MHSRICGRLKSANHKNYWVRKSQIRKVSHLQKVRNFKFLKSVHLRICDLRSLIADRPLSVTYSMGDNSTFSLYRCFNRISDFTKQL
jgi:hypothetical protein